MTVVETGWMNPVLQMMLFDVRSVIGYEAGEVGGKTEDLIHVKAKLFCSYVVGSRNTNTYSMPLVDAVHGDSLC